MTTDPKIIRFPEQTHAHDPNQGDDDDEAFEIEVVQHSELWNKFDQIEDKIIAACFAVFDQVGLPETGAENVTIVLSDNEEVQSLNKAFRGKDKPTNVLSFPFGDGEFVPEGDAHPLGDIILAFETVIEEAEMEDKCEEDHITHLVIHGLLHLLGYDHDNDQEAGIMEDLEALIMKNLGLPNPYEEASQAKKP